jgi:chemotaxis protein histidine kinase CheA/CheY-like chemotaxis protein
MIINGEPQSLASFALGLDGLRRRLHGDGEPAGPPDDLGPARSELGDLGAEAVRLGRPDLERPLQRLALLTEIGECFAVEAPGQAAEILAVCDEGLARLASALGEGRPVADAAAWLERESTGRWGRYLAVLAPGDSEADEGEPCEDPEIEVERLLQLLAGRAGAESSRPTPPRRPAPVPRETPAREPISAAPPPGPARSPAEADGPVDGVETAPSVPPPPVIPAPPATPRGETEASELDDQDEPTSPAVEEPEAWGAPASAGWASEAGEYVPDPLTDPDIRRALRADAEDLLERIGALAPQLEAPDRTGEVLAELGRCLHTLKGAAGTVGLTALVKRVHALEDRAESAMGRPGPLPPGLVDEVHGLLLEIEGILTQLGPAADSGSASDADAPWPGSPSGSPFSGSPPVGMSPPPDQSASEAEDLIRVPRAKLDEMMDLVADLFARNGPRAALAARMKDVASTARSCRHRLMASVDRLCDLFGRRAEEGPGGVGTHQGFIDLIRHLSEQADDLAILAEAARASADPLGDDALASSVLTGQLWDVLHEIRIVPIRPLFVRLARVARATARIEGKQVDVTISGEETGLDRLVQDRLFEPLLHVVRNAVGHGIEPPNERERSGKAPAGRIELEATHDGDVLVLIVRDDGRGLDYAAIAAKGRRLGLIGPGEAAGEDTLKALIFRPGFSTRDGADAVSGRGVGMDVVAREIARLHGRVELDSRPRAGTEAVVRIPARMAIQKGVVVRVDGQLFALPTESITAAPAAPGRDDGPTPLAARAALGLPPAPASSPSQVLHVAPGGRSFAVVVDAIQGPAELVIRPLPPLLAGHPVISGTSLSAAGELIFVLDPAGLVGRPAEIPAEQARRPDPVLLVDDSISVRRMAARHLQALGLEFEEASDGVEALQKLGERPYRLVLTDLDMPRMDGFGLLAEMGRLGLSPPPPVVVASARSDEATRRRVRTLGASAFVAKPVGVEDLAEAIGPLLGLIRA